MNRLCWCVSLALVTGCAGVPAPAAGKADAAGDAAEAAPNGGVEAPTDAGTATADRGAGAAPSDGPAMVLTDLGGTAYDVNKELAAGRNVVLAFWQVW